MREAKYSSLNHAEHNYSLCQEVSKLNSYPDWVVTLSFYSCLHYLREKLFPMKLVVSGKNVNVKSFDRFCQVKAINGAKHTIMKNLVIEKCPDNISSSYKRLLDLSYTSRYNQYQTSPKLADYALRSLEGIRKHCNC